MTAMGTNAERDGFVDKWRMRWPEWQVAEVFLPGEGRERWLAWFALRQELIDAAWAGADPRPGEAKLGWWVEELQGWSQGRRRHPLGAGLQSLPAPWARLAAGLPALAAARGAIDMDIGRKTLAPFADAIADVDEALATDAHVAGAADTVVFGLLGQRALLADDGALAKELLRYWPPLQGARGERILAALLRERLRRQAADAGVAQGLPRWRVLAIAWRAARQRQSVPSP
jgi:phytoene/squalene synthetase